MKKLLLSGIILAAVAAAAQFDVYMPTSVLNGQAGTIDIQFNPGSFPAVYSAGTATVSNFSILGGTLGALAGGPDGGASGSLPGPLTIINSDFLNGILYGATFGTEVRFRLDLSGAAFTDANQSILSLFSVNLTAGNDSVLAAADLLGSSTLDTTLSTAGVRFDAVGGEIPEPSTWSVVAIGLGAAAFLARRQRR